ncbi:hypothetical protein AVEN_202595-1 [Araneus ventricosus]|uniref:Uncharacterized protein n=1 Tax=Araneus ventricosus TaxID=182803 RepID=A0A4Y2QMT9_ARAVE|nr:hypothetical protein AVEN_202595-1 [Araneus ventricosus]
MDSSCTCSLSREAFRSDSPIITWDCPISNSFYSLLSFSTSYEPVVASALFVVVNSSVFSPNSCVFTYSCRALRALTRGCGFLSAYTGFFCSSICSALQYSVRVGRVDLRMVSPCPESNPCSLVSETVWMVLNSVVVILLSSVLSSSVMPRYFRVRVVDSSVLSLLSGERPGPEGLSVLVWVVVVSSLLSLVSSVLSSPVVPSVLAWLVVNSTMFPILLSMLSTRVVLPAVLFAS